LALWTVFFLIGAMAEGEPRGNSGARLFIPNLDHVGRCAFSSTASTNTAPAPMEIWVAPWATSWKAHDARAWRNRVKQQNQCNEANNISDSLQCPSIRSSKP
jgi:hypothetical protein